MFTMRKEEEEAKKRLLDNSIKLKQLKDLIRKKSTNCPRKRDPTVMTVIQMMSDGIFPAPPHYTEMTGEDTMITMTTSTTNRGIGHNHQ